MKKTLKICFSSSSLPLSKIISKVEKRPYSHVVIVIPEPMVGKQMVVHASHGMVHMSQFANFSHVNKIEKQYEINLDEDQYFRIWTYAMAALDTPYSIKQLIGIGIMKLFRLKKLPKFFINNDGGQICSEFVARIAQIVGVIITQELDSVTPSNLDKLLEQHQIKTLNFTQPLPRLTMKLKK